MLKKLDKLFNELIGLLLALLHKLIGLELKLQSIIAEIQATNVMGTPRIHCLHDKGKMLTFELIPREVKIYTRSGLRNEPTQLTHYFIVFA